MATPTDVSEFLDALRQKDPHISEIVEAAVVLVRESTPALSEGIKYGGIMFTADQECGGIFPSKNHVSFEFSRGYKMRDPDGLLLGTGKFRRHLKFRSVADIEAMSTEFFVQQMPGT